MTEQKVMSDFQRINFLRYSSIVHHSESIVYPLFSNYMRSITPNVPNNQSPSSFPFLLKISVDTAHPKPQPPPTKNLELIYFSKQGVTLLIMKMEFSDWSSLVSLNKQLF